MNSICTIGNVFKGLKRRKASILALASAGMALAIAQASAGPIQITATPTLTNPTGANQWGSPSSSNPADNVVASNLRGPAYQGQVWDLEAFSYDKTTGQLFLTGGYDFSKGYLGGLGPEMPGDLFITVGPANGLPDDGHAATAATGSTAPHGAMLNQFGSTAGSTYYTYAVDLSSQANGSGSGWSSSTPTVAVYKINGNAILDMVNPNDFSTSNPWRLDGTTRTGNSSVGLVGTSTVDLTYSPDQTSAQAGTLTGVTGLVGDTSGTPRQWPDGNSDLHNVVALNLSFLGNVPAGDNVYVSYAFECGNDSLKGVIPSGGFRQVPDGGATLTMVGMGLAGLTLVRRKVGKA